MNDSVMLIRFICDSCGCSGYYEADEEATAQAEYEKNFPLSAKAGAERMQVCIDCYDIACERLNFADLEAREYGSQ